MFRPRPHLFTVALHLLKEVIHGSNKGLLEYQFHVTGLAVVKAVDRPVPRILL